MLASNTASQPDILEVISDLSNDEVFSSPKLANRMLDLLPKDVWTNPELRFLDMGTKTGVFLREITKRLMAGLESTFPEEQPRLTHILKNMVFGVAITELTSLMARRTLYCSKDASSSFSVVPMDSPQGNIWFERVEHNYSSGKCLECGGVESQLERAGRENYAYAFIHESGREALREAMDMKFDVIVGNPPYQMESDGSSRTLPLYNLFVEQAIALNPTYIAMITPARWVAGGLGLGEYRERMLQDKRLRVLVDYPNASEVFPGVEIKGGVSYFLWDKSWTGDCEVTMIRGDEIHGPEMRDLSEYDVLVRDSRGLAILQKVLSHSEDSLMEILAVDKEFGMTSNFSGYEMSESPGTIAIYAKSGSKRVQGWIKRADITKSQSLIDKWKVLIPEAYGAGESVPHQVLGQTIVAAPPSVCTQTYLFVFTDSEIKAKSIDSYVRTRFVRFLIQLRKIGQHATRATYLWVPQQDWSQTWSDEVLYAKYGITTEEKTYIETMVKEMPA